jgi:hypothetical protein
MSSSAYKARVPDQQARTGASVGEQILLQAPLVSSVDKFGGISKRAIPGAAEYLRSLTGEPVIAQPIKNNDGYVIGWTYEMTRPHKRAREVGRFMVDVGMIPNEIHIANNYFIPDPSDRAVAWRFLDTHAWVKNGARVERMHGYPTSYSDAFEKGKTARNFGLYMKGDDWLRFEVRLWRARTLRRYITGNPADILDYHSGDILAHEFRLRFVKAVTIARWVKQQEARYGESKYKWATGVWEQRMGYAPREWLKKHTEIKPFTLGYHAEWQ